MATPKTPLPLSDTGQEAVIRFLTAATTLYASSYNIRNQLLVRDRAYYREEDQTKTQLDAKTANAAGDASKIQNITIPVVMPQVESALAYLSDTFLTGYPIFGVVAPPEFADAMGAMETIIGENSIRAGWPMELQKVLRDGLKYDLGAAEVVWEEKKTFSISTPELDKLSQGKVKAEMYAGTCIKHLDVYNLILDTRVSPDRNHIEGEFAGYSEVISRIETKKRLGDLNPFGTMNFRKALETGTGTVATGSDPIGLYYVPDVNPGALLSAQDRVSFDWMQWLEIPAVANKQPIAYKNSYEWTVLYARIIPYELGITGQGRNEIQIWKFIIINRQTVVFAERQTNAHNYLPIICCKPSNDGMGWQSKSFAENAIPSQQVASALTNSAIASQRRKVYDRMLYDPSRVRKQDIDNISPVARIPVKSTSFSKELGSAVYQIPYRDEGVGEILQMAQQVVGNADITNGQNRVQQGQFQKGNKTRSEFDTVMSNSNARQKMAATALEFSFFVPIKEIVKSNILQYQPPATLLNSQTKKAVEIDPEMLRNAMISFTLSDGLLPSDKIIDSSMFGTIMQAMPAMPAMQLEYDIMGMFTYVMQLKGAHWISDFKRNEEQKAQYLKQMQGASQATGNAPPEQPQPGEPA